MRRKSYTDMDCSVAQALDVVGDPWTLLIVRDAMWGFRRFNDFQERLGIPRNTLATRLAVLVDKGVFSKVAYQDNPERFEYRLTDKGQALSPIIVSLLTWGDEWSCLEEPPVALIDGNSGQELRPILVDKITGRPMSEIAVRPILTATGESPA